MELMDCSHVHFIQAIKGSLVVKTRNVDSHGRPAIRFMQTKAIYESENARNLSSHTMLPQQEDEFTGLPFGSFRDKIEMPGRTVKSEPETCELNENGRDCKSQSDWDELSFCDMTLKELRERCKTKKRKLPKSGDLTKQDIETCSHLDSISSKRDYANVQPKEDESDLEEPLSNWKLKLSKKSKAKRKCIGKRVCSSSKSAVSVEAVAEQIPSASRGSFHNTRDIDEPIDIKGEILEPDFSDSQKVVCVADSSSFDSHAKADVYKELPDEVHKRVNGCQLEIRESTSFTKESLSCVLNEVSFEYLELGEPVSLPIINKEIFREITKVDFLEMTSHESISSPVSELMKEDNITHPLPDYRSAEAIPVTKDPIPEIYGNFKSYSLPKEEISCHRDNNNVNHMPDMVTDDSLRCTELNYADGGCVFAMKSEVHNKEDAPPVLKANVTSNFGSLYISSKNSRSCLNPHSGSDSSDDGSPTAEEKHSYLTTAGPVYVDVSGAVDSFTGTGPSDATDELKAMEALENHHGVSPPKRLFSTRKAISPISQEKLRQAVNVEELYDNIEHSRIGSGLEGAEVTISPERLIKKPKNDMSVSPQLVPRGILKAPNVPCAIPHGGTESIHTRAQKAVAFSQRQMHDIECLATKLVKELKSMKDIVEETLRSEAYPSTPSKYTVDEMRTTIENAAEVEETTRKWLSMMARDCNRFCKIMRSTEKAAAASGYRVHKDRKKITFADEAGGMLCHVKVFEDSPTSVLVPESENGPETAS